MVLVKIMVVVPTVALLTSILGSSIPVITPVPSLLPSAVNLIAKVTIMRVLAPHSRCEPERWPLWGVISACTAIVASSSVGIEGGRDRYRSEDRKDDGSDLDHSESWLG
uniref:Uncharacterized protein n=1 Tax=Oryza sativa subsp. japonica TaxID=39947 RepID=Q8H5I8_ORYSJ|nr:hypothetical protein [Oryza sativa Japonica Group]